MSKKILLGFEFLHYMRESVSLRGSEARVREALSERAESESERSPLALSGERGSLRGICANICAVSGSRSLCVEGAQRASLRRRAVETNSVRAYTAKEHAQSWLSTAAHR